MSDMSVSKIDTQNLDNTKIREILASSKISQTEKLNFIEENQAKIVSALNIETPSPKEYQYIMEQRPLEKFRPLKNSFTKRGDRVLLADALGISVNDLGDYIKNVYNEMKNLNQLNIPESQYQLIKSYIYRHGSTDELKTFFNFELTKAKDKITNLHQTLEYNNQGVADYFVRPIHKMSDKTLVDLYETISKSLDEAQTNGQIDEKQKLETDLWALKQLYRIQHNNKLSTIIKAETV